MMIQAEVGQVLRPLCALDLPGEFPAQESAEQHAAPEFNDLAAARAVPAHDETSEDTDLQSAAMPPAAVGKRCDRLKPAKAAKQAWWEVAAGGDPGSAELRTAVNFA